MNQVAGSAALEAVPAPGSVVIVGSGQAGGELAISLRQQRFSGRIVLVGEEPHVPYKRPPLSKGFLAGTVSREQLFLAPAETLAKAGIELVSGVRVATIDRAAKRLDLADGRSLKYERLALTTGGRPRRSGLPGEGAENVFLLRNIVDVEAIRHCAKTARRVVIIGGGYIGLEVAAISVKLGLRVTVLESQPRVLARVTAPPVSSFIEAVHRAAGVDLRLNASVTAFEGAPLVRQVLLSDGSRIDTDFVIIGIGLVPETALASAAGLVVDDGIVVDEFTRTSDPDIVAAGDCTRHPSRHAGRNVRLESVQNAVDQARHAARTLAGRPEPYHSIPWFWSEQYDLRLQMVGLSSPDDEIVLRGSAAERSFSAFYIRGGRIVAADCINRSRDFIAAKKWVAEGASPSVIDSAAGGC
jgi:3-phenylpropionate/trans-cinnamate dioxygenase ferredoxin reductase subunit